MNSSMMKPRLRWQRVVAAVFAMMLLVACGGNGGSGDNAQSAGTEPEGPAQGTEPEGSATNAGSSGSIKVGLLVPESGVYAQLGEDMRQAWDLWLEQNGGTFGDLQVETVVADEGEGPETGVPGLQRLVQQEDVDVVVGVVNSAVALGGADVVTEAGKLFLISNAGANALTGEAGHDLIWRTSYTNSQRGYAAGKYLASLPEMSEGVFLAASDYAAGHEDIAGFKSAFEDAGGTVVGEAYSPFGTTDDYQPYLSQIRQSDANGAYAFYAGAETVAFIRQYAEFGLKGEIPLFGAGVITEAVLPALGSAAEGIRTVWHYSSQLETPENRAFVESYRDAYGALPSVFSVQNWDAATVLDMAVEASGGDVGGQALADALESLGEIPSPRGAWTFEGRNPRHAEYLREVQEVDGQYVNVVLEELGMYAQPDMS